MIKENLFSLAGRVVVLKKIQKSQTKLLTFPDQWCILSIVRDRKTLQEQVCSLFFDKKVSFGQKLTSALVVEGRLGLESTLFFKKLVSDGQTSRAEPMIVYRQDVYF